MIDSTKMRAVETYRILRIAHAQGILRDVPPGPSEVSVILNHANPLHGFLRRTVTQKLRWQDVFNTDSSLFRMRIDVMKLSDELETCISETGFTVQELALIDKEATRFYCRDAATRALAIALAIYEMDRGADRDMFAKELLNGQHDNAPKETQPARESVFVL